MNTIKMSDASMEKVVLLKQKKALSDVQKRLTDATIGDNCHGSGSVASSGELKKDMQDQSKILFRAISKCATRGSFVGTQIADIVCQKNGFEHCVTVVRGINKECENLRNGEKWVTVEELWGE